MASGFSYQTLPDNRIRLVNVDPGLSDDDPINCTLISVERSSVSYAALSYTWGDPTVTASILLNGEIFPVTINLWSALQVLRKQGREWNTKRLLWIDAICIDQANYEERAQQVRLMKSIYKAAHHVFIWLGNYSEMEDGQVHFPNYKWGFESLPPGDLNTTEAAFELAEELNRSFNGILGLKPYFDGVSKPSMNYKSWGYLSQIFQRTWFLRLWVIQELAVARKAVVYCGECMIEWQSLEGCVRAISAHIRSQDSSAVGQLPFIYNLCHQNVMIPSMVGVDRTSMISLIYRTRHSRAKEPLDRLYAIKNLLDEEDPDITVDYSVSIESAFREWTLKRIKRTGKLDALSLCTNTLKKSDAFNEDSWSSWVPDLTDLSGIDESLFFLGNGITPDTRNREYSAAGDTQWEETRTSPNAVSLTDSTLSLKSIRVGHIITLFPPAALLGIPVISSQLTAAMAGWEGNVLDHFGWPVTQEPDTSLFNAFVTTIFRGQVAYGEEGILPPFQDRYKVWRGISQLPRSFEPTKSQEERLKAYLGHFETILALMIGNTNLFITSNRSIGVISSKCNANIGDEIHVLFGANTPFVLRKNQDLIPPALGAHRLMGPCYLYDYMQGQAVAAWKKGEKESSTIDIV